MSREQLVGLDHGIVERYGTAAEFGGETDTPIAVVNLLNGKGGEIALIPDLQDLEPGTPVLLARMESQVGEGFHVRTQIVPKELL